MPLQSLEEKAKCKCTSIVQSKKDSGLEELELYMSLALELEYWTIIYDANF